MYRSRRVWAEHLGAHLLLGEFVHVKETAGWDAGKLKVYQIRVAAAKAAAVAAAVAAAGRRQATQGGQGQRRRR